MIVLFSDFGIKGPYIGQVEAVLEREAPGVRVINLIADAPSCDPKASAYLIAALADAFPPDSVFLAVVDPGVGGARVPGVLQVDGRTFVGPDNGLFELLIRRARSEPRWWEILWRPDRLSRTFHGRDLFAPIAARIAGGAEPAENAQFKSQPVDAIRRPEWPDDLAEVIYIDDFGNAMTGMRASSVYKDRELAVSGQVIPKAEKFSDLPAGQPFWYENANGLVEFAVNRGRADADLKLSLGSQVAVSKM